MACEISTGQRKGTGSWIFNTADCLLVYFKSFKAFKMIFGYRTFIAIWSIKAKSKTFVICIDDYFFISTDFVIFKSLCINKVNLLDLFNNYK